MPFGSSSCLGAIRAPLNTRAVRSVEATCLEPRSDIETAVHPTVRQVHAIATSGRRSVHRRRHIHLTFRRSRWATKSLEKHVHYEGGSRHSGCASYLQDTRGLAGHGASRGLPGEVSKVTIVACQPIHAKERRSYPASCSLSQGRAEEIPTAVQCNSRPSPRRSNVLWWHKAADRQGHAQGGILGANQTRPSSSRVATTAVSAPRGLSAAAGPYRAGLKRPARPSPACGGSRPIRVTVPWRGPRRTGVDAGHADHVGKNFSAHPTAGRSPAE
jgi:hypothetical protein